MKNNQRHMKIAIGDVALIKRNDKHRSKWNTGIVEELYEGKDNVIRNVKLRPRKTYIERPIQFLYLLELSCDTWKRQKTVHQCSKQPLNVNASEFNPLDTGRKLNIHKTCTSVRTFMYVQFTSCALG